jgi:hypothetical protein
LRKHGVDAKSNGIAVYGANIPWRFANAHTCIRCEVLSRESGWPPASLLMALRSEISESERGMISGCQTDGSCVAIQHSSIHGVTCVPGIPHEKHFHPPQTAQRPTTSP